MKKYPGWYYDEFKQVGVDYLDLEEVKAYDLRMRHLRDLTKEMNIVRNVLQINKNDLVLEIGTGTGELALNLASYCRKIIALDVSKKMIALAQSKAKMQKKENIEFYHAGFLTYEHGGEPFDVIITQLALHHLPDFWKMMALRKIYEMLKTGGKLYLRDVVLPSLIQDYGSYFTNLIAGLNKTAGEKVAQETETHIREEFSTLDWIMEALLKKVGFQIEETNYFDGFLATYTCKK